MRLPSLLIRLLVPSMCFVACGATIIDEEPEPPAEEAPTEDDVEEMREEPMSDPAYPLEGTACDTLCGGPACNHRCESDVLYHCGGDGVYRVVEDCTESGQTCEFVEAPDLLDSEKMCV